MTFIGGRVFNGKRYQMISRHKWKRNATQVAKEWRKAGSLARVVYEGGYWVVYRKPK